jgi:hypothetical protein
MVRVLSRLFLAGAVLLAGCVSQATGSTSTTPPSGDPDSPSVSEPIANAPVTNLLVEDPDGNPVAGAVVGGGVTTGDGGELTFDTPPGGVAVRAPGFVPRYVSGWLPGERRIVLQPVVVRGVVRTPAGDPLSGAIVTLGDGESISDESGRYEFVGAIAGTIEARRPGWTTETEDWLGRDDWVPIELEPIVVRALHVAGWTVGDESRWHELLDLAAATEINSLVVDLKDESGLVFYPTTVPTAEAVGAIQPEYSLTEVVSTVADADLYLIGRIVTFQDPIAARAMPSIAVMDGSTGSPYKKNGQYFLDPSDPDARQYALDLAAESCAAGFNEIQFDYVRYPDGFGSSAVFDQGSSSEVRPVVIRDFLAEASALLNPVGCAVAADIFGFITSTTGDGGIGQQLEDLALVADVLSPMLYPSHYSEGWFGFTVPNDHPGPVVSGALDDGLQRLDSSVVLRPWIQDFYYNASQVRAQIEAAEERGLGWMLWNALSRFTEGALNAAD